MEKNRGGIEKDILFAETREKGLTLGQGESQRFSKYAQQKVEPNA